MFETLPGFRTFLPDDCAARNHIFRMCRQASVRHGFAEYDAPVLEPTELFTKKSGEEIVGQLFAFEDKGGRSVALRPEMTPSLARLVGAQANSIKKPVKWFSLGEMYRYEKPQKGRLRAFYQYNADILGEPSAAADAELIALLLGLLTSFGLTAQDIVLRLSDRDLWLLFLEGMGLTDDKATEVLGIVDKLERADREETLKKLAPYFGDASEDFLVRVEEMKDISCIGSLSRFFLAQAPHTDLREKVGARLASWQELILALEAMGYGDFVKIDLGIVRGLAYYTGFVFEVFDREQANRAIAGGGRYDTLLEKLGYPSMPACGFGMGDVVLWDLLTEKKLAPALISKPDIYCVIGLGEGERTAALATIASLRAAGHIVEYPLKSIGFGKQFKNAGNSGARYALVFGESEVAQGKVKVRDMGAGTEEEVPAAELIAYLAQ